jgi:hypothetical protein
VILDRSHIKWILGILVIFALAAAGYRQTPPGATGSSPSGLLFGMSGVSLMLFAGLLPAGKKLARWRILRLRTLQRGHIWLGLLSMPLVLFHSGFRTGGPLSLALLVILAAILLSGIAGLLFMHQLPLAKEGKAGKAKVASSLITAGHKATLLLHIPLAVALLVLVVFHAVISLYF